jgi:TnpA family transposase
VPVEFLSDEQAAAYGRFTGEPSRDELERFFFLDDADRVLADKRRGDHNRLGFAVQLGTVRFLGTFLPDPLEVPWPVVEYLAAQLGVEDVSVAKRYGERLPTQHEHAREIRQAYGYRDVSDPGAAAGLHQVCGRLDRHHAGGSQQLPLVIEPAVEVEVIYIFLRRDLPDIRSDT